ncbi:MAG: hypothetical protein HQM03_15485 [Magnetococcales bacterium]|nr:hypothetical protein [Magnetococcales bacterium]
MPSLNKKFFASILPPLDKTVDKLMRTEKKLHYVFRDCTLEESPFCLNLGSIQEISMRADRAHDILRRATKRKRGAFMEPT